MKFIDVCDFIFRGFCVIGVVEWFFGVCVVCISMIVICIDGVFVDIWKVLFYILIKLFLLFLMEIVFILFGGICLYIIMFKEMNVSYRKL